MNKNGLAHKLELLLPVQDSQPESTPCWEWISNKLVELAAKAQKQEVHLHVDVYFREDNSAVCYTLYKELTDEIDKEEQSSFNFTLEEVEACQKVAEYNGIKYVPTFKPAPGFQKLIAFIY